MHILLCTERLVYVCLCALQLVRKCKLVVNKKQCTCKKRREELKGNGGLEDMCNFENDAGTMRDVSNKRALGLAKYQVGLNWFRVPQFTCYSRLSLSSFARVCCCEQI